MVTHRGTRSEGDLDPRSGDDGGDAGAQGWRQSISWETGISTGIPGTVAVIGDEIPRVDSIK
jgi:hypothetical protein